MRKKQFTLYLENKPGAISRITRLLASANVNIEGISVAGSTHVGLVQLVVSNATRTRQLLTETGVPFTVQDVALVRLKNSPGALSTVLSKLAGKGVNVNYIYATACECKHDCDCYVIISAPDLEAVEEAWSGSDA